MRQQSKFIFIANPFAMRGKGARFITRLENELKQRGIAYTLLTTEHPFHAFYLAQQAAEREPEATIVAVGGDGTVNEVANAIHNRGPTLGVVPIGSGNDFAKAIGLTPLDVSAAVETLLAGNEFTIDVGHIAIGYGKEPRVERLFVNGVGIGFDGYIAVQTLRYKRLRGWWLYLISLLRSVFVFRTPDMIIRLPGKEIHSPHLLVAIGNGFSSAGKFRLTPKAVLDDGELDICLVDNVSAVRIFRILPSVFKGHHDRFPDVHFLRTPKLEVIGARGLYVHADGEIISRGDISRFEISAIPHCLNVIGKALYRPTN